ncbi:hypothetical protein JVU11DRAFT_1119 [Chiua virens]|nr:hypothetical protein JVU11DRAFT_1119 [Chiua virens]
MSELQINFNMTKRSQKLSPVRRVRCWLSTDNHQNTFEVQVKLTDTFLTLKVLVKESKIEVLGQVDLKDIRLYAVSKAQLGPSLDLVKKKTLKSLDEIGDFQIVVIDGSVATRMNLRYWVYGDQLHVVDGVSVTGADNIISLRRALCKDNPDFNAGALRYISIYKVPQAMADGKNNISSVKLSELQSCGPDEYLGHLFKDFDPDRYLHIVVASLTLEQPIQCFIRGACPIPFQVRVPMIDTVDSIYTRIRNSGIISDTIPKEFDLFQIPVYDDDDKHTLSEVLGELGSGQKLEGKLTLEKVFLDVPLSKKLSVVIQSIAPSKLSQHSVNLDSLSIETDKAPPSVPQRPKNSNPISMERRKFLSTLKSARPSQSGTPASFRSRQLSLDERGAIPCGRPNYMEEVIPPTLLNPIFGEFVEQAGTHDPTYEDNAFVTDLARAMSDLYISEAERVQKVQDVLAASGKLNLKKLPEAKSLYPTDGALSVNEHHYVIAEFKNEVGSSSSEAYFQLLGYYTESTRETAVRYHKSTLPCFLLVMTGMSIDSLPRVSGELTVLSVGSQMCICAGVWNLRPSAQLLVDPIAFHFHSSDTHMQTSISRRLASLRSAILKLRTYYEGLQEPTQSSSLSQLFPYPMSYTCRQHKATRTFRYVSHLITDKLVFIGVGNEDNRRLCIKFVRSYSTKAHDILAEKEGAPMLWGFEKIAGGWFMAVMDMLDGYQPLHDAAKPIPSTACDNILTTVGLLHKKGYVHGDIRDTNIMISNDGDYIKLIDFDWAGKDGEARYPACVNFKEIQRPADARDGQLIRKAHDEDMLQQLIAAMKNSLA